MASSINFHSLILNAGIGSLPPRARPVVRLRADWVPRRSRPKRVLDAACGVQDWVIHDLRCTVATRMADIGIQPHIIEAVLNHVSGHKAGVAGIYNRSTYAAEKRAALDAWANHLRVILAQAEGANVVAIRKA